MASTLTKLLVHITTSTKARHELIAPGLEPELHAYIGGICRNLDSPVLSMGGTADHIHMLVGLSKAISLSEFMLNVKRESSKWLKQRVPSFAWQDGYFGFSIGQSQVAQLMRYIAGQKQHHRTIDFKEEMRAFLRKYDIEWDERHIWENGTA